MTGFAAARGADPESVGSIALAVTEAATNAVLHAFIDMPAGHLHVLAEAGQGRLLVRVIDDGRGMTPRSDSPGLGLGLPTMASLAASCDIREGPGGGTEVRLVFTAPGVTGPYAAEGESAGPRLELLSEIARLAEWSIWPARGIDDLIDVLVPRVADLAAIDLIDSDGNLRRIAARVEGEQGAEWTRWLAHRVPRPDVFEQALTSLRAGDARVLEMDEATLRAISRDEAEADTMAAMKVAYWINVPLVAGRRLFGSLGLGLRSDRPALDDDHIAFLKAVGERAAAGLAQTRLVDELQRTRRRFERILGALAEAVTVQDSSGRMIYANQAAASLLGAASVEEVLASTPQDLMDRFTVTLENGGPVALRHMPGRRLLEGGQAEPLLTRSVHRATGRERWLLTKATRLDDDEVLIVNIIEDVTEAKEAERRQRFLAEAGTLLASSLDYEQTLEHVAGLAVPTLADWCAVDLVDEAGGLERVALTHVDPDRVVLGVEMQRRYPPDLSQDRGLGSVLRSGRSELYPAITDDMLAEGARDEEHLGLLRGMGMRSAMIVPMEAAERVIGTITFVTSESRRVFDPSDLSLAEEIARRAATAVVNARLYSRRADAS